MKFDCPHCKGEGKISYSLHDENKPNFSVIAKLLASSIDWKHMTKEQLEDPSIQEIKNFMETENEK